MNRKLLRSFIHSQYVVANIFKFNFSWSAYSVISTSYSQSRICSGRDLFKIVIYCSLPFSSKVPTNKLATAWKNVLPWSVRWFMGRPRWRKKIDTLRFPRPVAPTPLPTKMKKLKRSSQIVTLMPNNRKWQPALAATLAVQRQFHNSTYINAIIYNDPLSKKHLIVHYHGKIHSNILLTISNQKVNANFGFQKYEKRFRIAKQFKYTTA